MSNRNTVYRTGLLSAHLRLTLHRPLMSGLSDRLLSWARRTTRNQSEQELHQGRSDKAVAHLRYLHRWTRRKFGGADPRTASAAFDLGTLLR